MTFQCFECQKEIQSYPCACGYQPKTLAVLQRLNWIVRDCSTPGCFTAIRERVGEQSIVPVCKWCAAGLSHAKHGKPSTDIRRRETVTT